MHNVYPIKQRYSEFSMVGTVVDTSKVAEK